jgi:SAM-dependent methyltransferase
MENPTQTFTSFRDKWEQNKDLAFTETSREDSDIFKWILTRNGFSSTLELCNWLSNRNRVLDAGCGNGRVTALLDAYAPPQTSIVGIDLTAAHVAKENLINNKRVHIEQKDLLSDLSDIGKFDLIYCQEVLHHTANPRGAFLNLCKCLEENGEIAIYVYKLKAPIREYVDDFIRDSISTLSYKDAIKDMSEITELGKILSELDVKVKVPNVKILGIEEGEYDIQRFIYHFFLKCFWNPDLSENANIAINYDWYHPQLCTRHTLEEVKQWFTDAGLEIIHHHVDHYGITVRGVSQKQQS